MTKRPTKPRVVDPGAFHENPEAWLAAIVESSDDAIISKTLDGVVQSWNAGAARMFGYAPSEIIGRSILTLIPPDLHHQETEIVDRLLGGDRIDHFETVRLRKDGDPIDVSLSVSPIRDAAGAIVGAAKIARDITESNRLLRAERDLTEQLQSLTTELEQQVEEGQALAEELEMTNEQLAQAVEEAERARQQSDDANAAKSAFLATMSHELRTPLNAITGYLDLLDLGVRGPLLEPQREDLARIKRSADTLLRLIDDVLSFAKLERGRLEFHFDDLALDDFAATLESFVAPRVALKGLTYRLTPSGSNVVVRMDRAKVEQIMLNLLSNAVKFTDAGRIDVVCTANQHHVAIAVRDTGHGVRPELLVTIFEPFVQGDRSLTRTAEGTGLGLSISRQLARAMGGDILVESALGNGSTFTLILPHAL